MQQIKREDQVAGLFTRRLNSIKIKEFCAQLGMARKESQC